ncbi:MAG: sulfatase-like hydrolase/transferase [Candidatus Sumerlaeota bacterium]|nr:sulfatase-like hydrolase/transferase [Candidatus Sumerlaeota bacterium]
MKIRQTSVLLIASLLLASLSLLRAAEPAKPPAKPNIVIILADDMGYSDPGYMGGEARTPHLDRLSREGVTFLNCFNNAKCAPTRAALMTGLSCQKGSGSDLEKRKSEM